MHSEQASREDPPGPSKLLKELRFYRFFFGFSLFSAVLGAAFAAYLYYGDFLFPWQKTQIQKGVPYKEEVRDIIDDLRYTALPALMRPEVSVEIDFPGKKWKLRNIHRFAAEGNVLIEDGKSGICGDLAAHTFQKIRPLFSDRYSIEYVQVCESGYFHSSAGTHIVLRIIDREAPFGSNAYILDPSFRKYGRPQLFDEYLPIVHKKQLQFVAERDPDEVFDVGGGPPILINRKVLISLYVLEEKGRFDREHFRLELVAAKKYKYIYEPVFAIGRSGGAVFVDDPDTSVEKLLKPGVYADLFKRVRQLFERLDRSLKSGSE